MNDARIDNEVERMLRAGHTESQTRLALEVGQYTIVRVKKERGLIGLMPKVRAIPPLPPDVMVRVEERRREMIRNDDAAARKRRLADALDGEDAETLNAEADELERPRNGLVELPHDRERELLEHIADLSMEVTRLRRILAAR